MQTFTEQRATKAWNPAHFLCPFAVPSPCNEPRHTAYALLVLNQPIQDKSFFKHLWNNSRYRICGDGGGNRLHDAFEGDERIKFGPDAICGDLDSLRSDVRAYYSALQVDIVQDPDQNSTDFGKCLEYIRKHYEPALQQTDSLDPQPATIIVYNSLGGRVDHSFHSIHQLYLAASEESAALRQIFLVSDDGVTFLLSRGCNVIQLPQKFFGPACGIVPVGGPSVITTSGLMWDVVDWATSFGGRMSTSNVVKGDMVKVVTTEPVLFAVEIQVEAIIDRGLSQDRLC
ncbi:thiamine pyrophosphokinase [Kalaharituber pfeilii]|nr:thiamine pyrophosphokinase [Kalaharituber pfeilii]